MSEIFDDGERTLRLSQALRINEVCNRFELAWRAGQRPRIEDYLGDAAEPERSDLLRELVALEIDYRRQAGQEPALDEYRTRFPGMSLAPTLVDRAAEGPGPRVGEPETPPAVPGYEILGKLGLGGMGVVYKAHHRHLNRVVALKMIRAGSDASPTELVRFRHEAETVARLQHPNIVQIYEVGAHAGHSYLALEYVECGSLAKKTAGVPQPPRDVARLVELLARALDYAHQNGILHRDVSPGNVLLTSDGAPKLTDFGLARPLNDPWGMTTTGAILGTPGYMAPEQATASATEIGRPTDVFGLGATLYYLLTGRPPFQAANLYDTILQTKERDPVSVRQLNPGTPGDLETICLKCLEKQPGRRYASAGELAEDLRRFLAGEPIRARPVGNTERLWRWCRRNPAVAGLAAAVVLLLVALTVGTLVKNAQLAAALHDSERANEEAREANRQANERLWESLRAQARAWRMSRHPGQRVESLKAVREALQLPLPPGHSLGDLRKEAIAALALPDLELLREWDLPADSVGLDFDGNLEHYACLATDGTVSVRLVRDDAVIGRWREPTEGPWSFSAGTLRFSPDGRFLCIRHRTSGRLTVRRPDDPEPAVYQGTKAADGWTMDFSSDGKRLAYILTDNRIVTVDLTSRQASDPRPTGAGQEHIRYAPDGRRFAVAAHSAGKWAVEMRDSMTGQVVGKLLPHPGKVTHPAWHPDGRMLATGCDDLRLRLWDEASGQLLRELKGHTIQGINCTFTGTGDRLLSNDWSDVLRVWEPSSGRQLLSFPASGYNTLRVSPDDRVSELGGPDHRKAQLLRLHPGLEYRTISPAGLLSRGINPNASPKVHPAGRLLAARATDGSVVLVDLIAGRQVGTLPIPWGMPLLWERPEELLTAGTAGILRWPVREDPVKSGRYRFGPREWLLPGSSENVDWGSSADGQTIAAPDRPRGAVVAHRGSPARTLRLQPQQDVRHCAVSPDGRWVATGSHGTTEDFGAKVWNAATGELAKELLVPGLCEVAFSPDGRWLLTNGGGCRLWKVGSWNEGPKIGGAFGCFSPDGQILAAEDSLGAIRLIRSESGEELARLESQEQTRLLPRCFTPDGGRLIAVGRDTQALHVWDLWAVRRELAELNLDWDSKPYPPGPEPATVPPPLTVTVEMGDILKNP
jgi:WD40 repeat protein